MNTWLLLSIGPDERSYQGHLGYEDDLQRNYRYDSFVPNHKRVAVGDIAIIRRKKDVHGVATITTIATVEGKKTRHRCPICGGTKFKDRKHSKPRYRCECKATFDNHIVESDNCIEYSASFGDTYSELLPGLGVKDLWALSPRLNKQLAILELDTELTRSLLLRHVKAGAYPDELPISLASSFVEGNRSVVTVNRAERDPKARRACLSHYGFECAVCGFRFCQRYGDIGVGVIEVHHIDSLSLSSGPRTVDPIQDLRPICSNCHTIIHRRDIPFSIEEVKAMLR